MKVNTIYSYNWEEQKYEENNQPSQTVPDQTMSIREIIDRYANGGIIERFEPYYGEEEDFNEMLPDTYKMDLAEKQNYFEEFANEFKEWQEKPTEPVESGTTTAESE